MKADERHELEQNALARRLGQMAEKAKAGQLNYRVIGIAVAVLLIAGAWWFYARSNRIESATAWKQLDGINGPEQFVEYAKTNPNSLPSRVARLQYARTLLGPNGLQQMSSPNQRKTAVENVEKARDEFAKLADELKSDLTLRAQSLDGQAHAELALVGVPEEKDANKDRGSVEKAADLFRQFAKLVGEDTEVGKQAAKKADELLAQKDQVLQVAKDLNTRLTPAATAPDIKIPSSVTPTPEKPGVETPKAPTTPIPPPTPPAGTGDSKGTEPTSTKK